MPQDERIIEMKRTIQADRARVFAALTEAGRLREWLCDHVWSDPRPGGRYSLRWNSGYEARGTFVELEAPEEITMIWQGMEAPGPTLVAWELEEGEGGTEVALEHGGFGRGTYWDTAYAEAKHGWELALENLQSVLVEGVDLRQLRQAFWGVHIDEVDARRAEEEGIATTSGIYVPDVVEGGAAEEAGVQAGDVIVALGDHQITGFPSMGVAMSTFRAGDTVAVGLVRGQEELTVSVTMGSREMPEVPGDPEEALGRLRQRYEELQEALTEATAGVSEEEASLPPAEGEWTVKQVLAHLSGGERFLHRLIVRLAMGQWVEGNFDPTRVPDVEAVILEMAPTLAGQMERFLGDMEETLLLVEHLPEAARAERYRYREIVSTVLRFGEHVEEHVGQIRDTVAAVRETTA